ncbi:ABC transporter ATP-binding protein [Bradyrhizobium mercantei]|uniref:ABC transporter ATP-binding protein n=1 Tax=Bradyrhizobium mercantei TaxID=1904807 RepID=UPI0009755257|nr:ABC transporter ATP-binding protein [Bradyrhizobium mercantei]
MLKVDKLNAWYGRSHVVQDVSFEVAPSEIVTLLGRNGAGKSTTIRSIMGLVAKRTGSVIFGTGEVLAAPSWKRFEAGLAYVPEHRSIVPGLTVLENLRLGLIASPLKRNEHAIIDEIAETFPRLKQRLSQEAVTLSGGEQQMLAIARAVASKPAMILLDEPSEGIMPVLVDEMFEYFDRLRGQGTTILLIEQNVEIALRISDRAYILDQGAIVHQGSARDLLADREIQERYCSV